jgi:TatD related DNase
MRDDTQFRGVDFHCHLDLYPDHKAAIARAEAAGIYTLTVTTTPKAWPLNLELTRNTRHVRAALGLHPQLAVERASELSLWERHLPEARYVGEVGLDAGPRFYKSLNVQKRVFRTVLERCAEAGGKILTVHSVRSTAAVLDMVEAHLPPRPRRSRLALVYREPQRGAPCGGSRLLFLGQRFDDAIGPWQSAGRRSPARPAPDRDGWTVHPDRGASGRTGRCQRRGRCHRARPNHVSGIDSRRRPRQPPSVIEWWRIVRDAMSQMFERPEIVAVNRTENRLLVMLGLRRPCEE